VLENENEIRKMQGEYQDKSDTLSNGVLLLQNSANAAKNPKQVKERTERAKDAVDSSLFELYDNLQKNCDSVVRLGPSAFPNVDGNFDSTTGQFNIDNSPAYSRILNKYFPSLYTLAKESGERYLPGDRKTTPCFNTMLDSPMLSKILPGRRKNADFRDVEVPDLTQKRALQLCSGPKCMDCIDCGVHQDELHKALTGIARGPKDMRSLHMKNLITVLNSWSVHQNSRGGNRNTQDDPRFQECSGGHQKLGTALRMIGHRLHLAYNDDYKTTGGLGGGRHRDRFSGYGDDMSAY